jgi:hypothetical protein
MHGVGKRVGDHLYVHVESVDHVGDKTERATILEAFDRLPSDARAVVNVAKLNVRNGRVALLEYVAFDEDPFPALANSWASRDAASTSTLRTYADSLNPPILHRKELLVHRDHPKRDCWAALTSEAEALGFFDNVQSIGFRMNCERLIAGKATNFGAKHSSLSATPSRLTGTARSHGMASRCRDTSPLWLAQSSRRQYNRAGPVDLNRFPRFISGPCGIRLLRPKAEAAMRSTPRPGFELDGSSAAGACCRS